MDFKKLGQQVGQLRKQAEEKLGDRADPDVLKKDGKELRNILAGDGSLAEKAKEAKEKMADPDRHGSDESEPASEETAAPTTDDPAPGPSLGDHPSGEKPPEDPTPPSPS